jgi:hypothetical protein
MRPASLPIWLRECTAGDAVPRADHARIDGRDRQSVERADVYWRQRSHATESERTPCVFCGAPRPPHANPTGPIQFGTGLPSQVFSPRATSVKADPRTCVTMSEVVILGAGGLVSPFLVQQLTARDVGGICYSRRAPLPTRGNFVVRPFANIRTDCPPGAILIPHSGSARWLGLFRNCPSHGASSASAPVRSLLPYRATPLNPPRRCCAHIATMPAFPGQFSGRQ